MDHYPDPYDNETEKRSRDFSLWAFKWLAGLLALSLIGVIFINLWGE